MRMALGSFGLVGFAVVVGIAFVVHAINAQLSLADPRLHNWWLLMVSVASASALSLRLSWCASDRVSRSLALVYCTGSAYRSIFPVLWEARPHGCLLETPGMIIGGDLADQLLSHAAETAFAILISRSVSSAQSAVGCHRLAALSGNAYLLIAIVARLCCWCGCTTDHKGFHVVEESSWTMFASIMLLTSLPARLSAPRGACGASAKLLLTAVLPVCLLYVHFMVTTDVPMYIEQMRADAADGVVHSGFWEGLKSMSTCHRVVTDFEPWREAVTWQTGYFAVFPFIAILLARMPTAPRRVAMGDYNKLSRLGSVSSATTEVTDSESDESESSLPSELPSLHASPLLARCSN